MNDVVLVSKSGDFTYRPKLLINGAEVQYYECQMTQENGQTVMELRVPVRSIVTTSPEEGELMSSVRRALSLDK